MMSNNVSSQEIILENFPSSKISQKCRPNYTKMKSRLFYKVQLLDKPDPKLEKVNEKIKEKIQKFEATIK